MAVAGEESSSNTQGGRAQDRGGAHTLLPPTLLLLLVRGLHLYSLERLERQITVRRHRRRRRRGAQLTRHRHHTTAAATMWCRGGRVQRSFYRLQREKRKKGNVSLRNRTLLTLFIYFYNNSRADVNSSRRGTALVTSRAPLSCA